MTEGPDRYAQAGVDVPAADRGVASLVSVLRAIDPGRPSRVVDLPGHYASVLRLTDTLGLALCTDGVGSKLVLAEAAGRLDTVGIDCIAMNVNDLVCVGAEPLAMVDYLAVEEPDEERFAQIARGLARGAELAGIEIPGGEVAVLPELIRGHPSPGGFDLCGTAVGTVDLDAILVGDRCSPGDVLVGVPSSGPHSNGYTLARRALAPLGLEATPDELGGRSVLDALLEPTTIYVRAALELLRADEVDLRGLAHITGGGLDNLTRLNPRVGWRVDQPLPVPPIFDLIARHGDVDDDEMWDVFNMGCGLVAVVPEGDADEATRILDAHHPGAAPIGTVTDLAGVVERH